MTRLIDADELLAALEGLAIPHAVAEALRNAPPAPHVLTYEDVVDTFRDKMRRTGSLDAALMKVAWTSFNRGLDAAKS